MMTNNMKILINIRFGSTTAHRFHLVNHRLQNSSNQTLTYRLRLRPRITRQASQTRHATIRQISNLIRVGRRNSNLQLDQRYKAMLYNRLPRHATGQLRLTLLIRRTREILGRQRIFRTNKRVIQTPPHRAPRIPTVRNAFGNLTTRFQHMINFRRVLQHASFLGPRQALKVLTRHLNRLDRMRYMQQAFLANDTMSLHSAIGRPKIGRNRVTLNNELRQHRQIPIGRPDTVISTMRYIVPFTNGNQGRYVRPYVSLLTHNTRLHEVQPIERLVSLITRNGTLRHKFLKRLVNRNLSRFALNHGNIHVNRRITHVPNSRP